MPCPLNFCLSILILAVIAIIKASNPNTAPRARANAIAPTKITTGYIQNESELAERLVLITFTSPASAIPINVMNPQINNTAPIKDTIAVRIAENNAVVQKYRHKLDGIL